MFRLSSKSLHDVTTGLGLGPGAALLPVSDAEANESGLSAGSLFRRDSGRSSAEDEALPVHRRHYDHPPAEHRP